MASGQTVLLAGLISEGQTVAPGRAGARPDPADRRRLRHDRQGSVRTELIIFIRPQIIRDGADASMVAEELRSKMRGGQIDATALPASLNVLAKPLQ